MSSIYEVKTLDKINKLKKLIEESENIVFFGGAGVSTESNIPDFRSADGIYNSGYKIPPEEILSRDFFFDETQSFYDFYKDKIICNDALPNKAHYSLRRLELQGKLKAVITQNIDGLHQMAGSELVHELHGSITKNHCVNCHESYDLEVIIKSQDVPRCHKCGDLIKPDVVLYQEGLDNDVIASSVTSIINSDLLIVGGTSLLVYPAAGFIEYHQKDNLVLINKSETSYDQEAKLVINHSIGAVLNQAVEGYDHVIWDFDGTLVDTYPCMIAGFVQALEHLNIRFDYKTLVNQMKVSVRDTVIAMAKDYGVDPLILRDLFMKFDRSTENMALIQLFEDTRETLQALKANGVKSYIITHRDDSTKMLLERFELTSYFEQVITSENNYQRKPNPEAFLALMHDHGLKGSQTLVVGDRGLDMMAGKNAGCHTCFYKGNGLVYSGQAADFSVDKLTQVIDIV